MTITGVYKDTYDETSKRFDKYAEVAKPEVSLTKDDIKYAGKKVKHPKFGDGEIEFIKNDRMSVIFNSPYKRRLLKYSFVLIKGLITTEDKKLIAQFEKDKKTAELEAKAAEEDKAAQIALTLKQIGSKSVDDAAIDSEPVTSLDDKETIFKHSNEEDDEETED